MASIIGVETLQHTNGTTAATIDSSGRILQPAKPAFRASGSSNGSVSTTNGGQISFPNAGLNQGSYYNTTTNEFTCPVDGVYFFNCTLHVSTSQTQGFFIKVNDAAEAFAYHASQTGGYEGTASATLIKELSAGDVVDVESSMTGSYYGGSAYSYFQGYLIG